MNTLHLNKVLSVFLASSPNLSSTKDLQDVTLKSEPQDRPSAAFIASQMDDKAKTRSRELLKS